MASSLQAFIGASANGVVAGLIAPWVMHSTVALAAASLAMLSVGLLAAFILSRFPAVRAYINTNTQSPGCSCGG